MLLMTGYEQEIKRFYFSDVQAITVRRTLVGRVNNVVILSFAGLSGIAASSTSGGFAAFWVIVALIFGLFAIINTWQGPTCITELKTAVQVEKLSSLNRVRTAEKTLSLLRPHIEAAQGTLSVEEIQFHAGSIPPVYRSSGTGTEVSNLGSKPLKSCSGRVHQILFALLILDGCTTLLQIVVHPTALLVFGNFVSLGAAGLVVTALIQQNLGEISTSVRRLTWLTCVFVALSFVVATIQGSVVATTNASGVRDQMEVIKAAAQIDPLSTPWLLTVLVVSSAVSLSLGIVGSIMTFLYRDRKLHMPVLVALPPETGTPV